MKPRELVANQVTDFRFQLAICCLWTFVFQIIGMSYYLYSAELPSALLRVKTGPFTFFVNSVFGIATW